MVPSTTPSTVKGSSGVFTDVGFEGFIIIVWNPMLKWEIVEALHQLRLSDSVPKSIYIREDGYHVSPSPHIMLRATPQ